MKVLSLIIGAVTTFALQACSEDSLHPPATLEVTNAGHVQSLDASKQDLVRFWFQQLMLSALYRDVVQDSSPDEWQKRLSSQSRIYCHYSSVATLAIPERRTLTFDEALLPLPSEDYPDYIFIKRGEHVVRLAKYDPWVLHKLVAESGFSLYERLSTVERGLF
jgi:hypothetical protein